MTRKPLHFVRALARGLSVLQAFSAERPKMTLTEIAAATGLNLAATQRLTDTLLQLGYLGRDEAKRFYLGPKVLTLGFSFLGGSKLRQQAEPFLKEFSRRHSRTVNMGVLDGTEVVFLARAESERFLKFDLRAGSRLPAHLTGQGRVLLAALGDQELADRIEAIEMEKVTSHTVIDRSELMRDLMETRRRGYAVADRQLSLDLYSMGVPLLNGRGKVVAAVNLSLRTDEAKGEHLREMTGHLMGLGRELSAAMGYSGPYPVIPVSGDAGGGI